MKDYGLAPVGVEGVVAKGAGDPYGPDQRGWVKVKIRDTADALIGAVVGSLDSSTRSCASSASPGNYVRPIGKRSRPC
jgi:hypothetical protein